MNIEHLQDYIDDYNLSITTVVDKKILWGTATKNNIKTTLKSIVNKYNIGWKVQELNWMGANEAINITFESFPIELIEKTNTIPSYQFVQGGTLVFSQSYTGDVHTFIMFPYVDQIPDANSSVELETYNPKDITEKLVIEKVEEFLKEMIKWEVPSIKHKLGY
jgi:hypothetical protein